MAFEFQIWRLRVQLELLPRIPFRTLPARNSIPPKARFVIERELLHRLHMELRRKRLT
jgi:hypothetical protein